MSNVALISLVHYTISYNYISQNNNNYYQSCLSVIMIIMCWLVCITLLIIITLSLSLSLSITLLFITFPSLDLPSILTPPTSLSVPVSGSASFTCITEGNPTPQIQWLFNGVSLLGAQVCGYYDVKKDISLTFFPF